MERDTETATPTYCFDCVHMNGLCGSRKGLGRFSLLLNAYVVQNCLKMELIHQNICLALCIPANVFDVLI